MDLANQLKINNIQLNSEQQGSEYFYKFLLINSSQNFDVCSRFHAIERLIKGRINMEARRANERRKC